MLEQVRVGVRRRGVGGGGHTQRGRKGGHTQREADRSSLGLEQLGQKLIGVQFKEGARREGVHS